MKTWTCKIGEVDGDALPDGADLPMRTAVRIAYREIAGQPESFIFSGWGGELTEIERAEVEGREPEQQVALGFDDASTRDLLIELQRRFRNALQTAEEEGKPDPRAAQGFRTISRLTGELPARLLDHRPVDVET